MKYKSLLGIKAVLQNGHSYFGYIFSENDLSSIPLDSIRFFLIGSMLSKLDYDQIQYVSVFNQDNASLLFELVIHEPVFIYERSLSELQKILAL